MSLFPFADALGFGLGVLGLSPDAFWAMTPRELQAAINGRSGCSGRLGRSGAREAMPRGAFDALIRCFPDSEA